MKGKHILVSGAKPTGQLHLGNYFGALKQWVELQEQYECRVFIADLHALTNPAITNIKELSQELILDFLGVGMDPEKVLLYRQSDVPEVTEFTWYFSNLVTMPYLMRAHAFKDAEAKNKEIVVGTFMYPVLMAADILIHKAHVVPVGKDQAQHLEIARDIATKANLRYKTDFPEPQALIREEVATVPGLDGQKMSKSYNNTIPLFADEATLKKAVMSIVTDSKAPSEPKDPNTCNIFALHKLISVDQLQDLEQRYRKGTIGYKESKEILLDNIKKMMAPMIERRKSFESNPELVEKMLLDNAAKVKALITPMLQKIRNGAVGHL